MRIQGNTQEQSHNTLEHNEFHKFSRCINNTLGLSSYVVMKSNITLCSKE